MTPGGAKNSQGLGRTLNTDKQVWLGQPQAEAVRGGAQPVTATSLHPPRGCRPGKGRRLESTREEAPGLLWSPQGGHTQGGHPEWNPCWR